VVAAAFQKKTDSNDISKIKIKRGRHEVEKRIFPKYIKLKKGEEKVITIINVPESIKNIKDSLDNIEGTWKFHNMQGAPWHVVEKKTLKKEIEFTIKTIAANHGRTEKAIKARLVKIGALDY